MDPTCTLRDIIKAIEQRDRERAVQDLDALKIWLMRGGFYPDIEQIKDEIHEHAERTLER